MLDPTARHPMVLPDGTVVKTVVNLNQVVDHPRMEIGDFSYYSNFNPVEDYAAAIAPYLFPLSPERLVIGRFVQIAHGVVFITSSANHDMRGFSTYPFWNFTMTPETGFDEVKALFNLPGRKGDTVIGNDVWLGMEAVVMPGVTIGDGAIIGARSVVGCDVPPYAVVAGNPARVIRMRFDQPTIDRLQAVRWWDWPLDRILARREAISGADLTALEG
ncbi:flagellar repeat-containing transferase [Pseudodesulfovibrio mercurii]|uniref:Flagellar repeat-containing transferase n=1 Tax=Pseudodesulfovibrio mercurii TaxID=641491 RepID=F0JGH4_9BACT|nr:CatB-related O-acetyltransferase [Pseudodesulfovibrio mercurii]EGB15091.1 flagellar repeat-containing transferase [Pseudodesulfovibrio mercurii]